MGAPVLEAGPAPAGGEGVRPAVGPPESRGLARDGVRLLIARPGRIEHRRFRDLPEVLVPGDVLIVNTSATLPAALRGVRADGRAVPVHVAAVTDDGDWVLELRRPDGGGPLLDVGPGESIALPGGRRARIGPAFPDPRAGASRLHRASIAPAADPVAYLARHGRPIEYSYLAAPQPLAAHQTVYADEPGSAEMPSAGRPFTARAITRLVARGVTVVPVVLHAGVSSPEPGEPPAPERFRVPEATARIVDGARLAGARIVAVGTTATRAIESATGRDGTVRPARGWTGLVLGPERPARTVTGIVSGLHPPEASHLMLLEAVAGPDLVRAAYAATAGRDYLWHEFGDAMLFLP
jgi:S-adenosylmethionine:tRNA ribosyltransferase-isomerase